MIAHAKAPLRLGLAGGGTDVSPYCEIYGGAILNATISMYAYAMIEPRTDGKIILNSRDRNEKIEASQSQYLEPDGQLDLLKGVYNRVVRDFTKKPFPFELSTFVDAPAGSGLGTSSTLVVAVLAAFAEMLKLPLGEYDLAHLAWEIERKDLKMAGGRQDQYAATFGGFNFMEFFNKERIVVNPLRIRQDYLSELEFNLLLYHTGTSRLSSTIIEAQTKNVLAEDKKALEAMHQLKEQSLLMKEAILKGRFGDIGEILDFGWRYKKQMTDGITNPVIDEVYEAALKAGASGGKLSGAGGGGFFTFYCPGNKRYKVMEGLRKFGGTFSRFNFVKHGVQRWSSRWPARRPSLPEGFDLGVQINSEKARREVDAIIPA